MVLALSIASTRRPAADLPPTFAESALDAVLNAAAAELKAGRPGAAREGLADLNPSFVASPERCQLAGLILMGSQAWREATVWFMRALELRPGYIDAIAQLGPALQKLGRSTEALAAFDELLKLGRADATVFYDRGVLLRTLGRPAEAIVAFDQALRLKPAYPEALRAGATILSEAGQSQSALEFLDEAIRLKPGYFEALLDRANVLHKLGRLDAAAQAYERALDLFPGNADLCNNYGAVLRERGDLAAAVASFDAALAANPEFPEAHFNRGSALLKQGAAKDALIAFNRSLSLRPIYPAALVGRGIALKELGCFDEACEAFDVALVQEPDSAHAANNKGALQLLRGDFADGWQNYEQRWIAGQTPKTKLKLPIPEWDGGSHPGEKLIVFDEQGFGDTLQFCRYLPLLAKADIDVTFFCRSTLVRLLGGLRPQVRCVSDLGPNERFDSQIALSSLPRAFQTRLTTIPARVPYLSAEPYRVAKWAEHLASRDAGKFKIGLCWHGSANPKADPCRTVPLSCFAKLAARDDLRLISLQKGGELGEGYARTPATRIEQLGEHLDAGADAFIDTAAVMQTLDLIITCDTSIAHLAGALGRPVFVVLKKVPDWRWLLDREDSPWYPTMRLFRQRERGDWDDVVARVGQAVDGLIAYTSGLQALRSAAMI